MTGAKAVPVAVFCFQNPYSSYNSSRLTFTREKDEGGYFLFLPFLTSVMIENILYCLHSQKIPRGTIG